MYFILQRSERPKETRKEITSASFIYLLRRSSYHGVAETASMADPESAVAGCPVRHLAVDGKRYRYYDVAGALGERFAYKE